MGLLKEKYNDSQPRCLPGFEHINRYWDKRNKMWAAKLLPGEFYVSCSGERIVTVLGSCVSACIRDVENGIGGMNHFMLPVYSEFSSWNDKKYGFATRFGNVAMEYLINEILKAGGSRSRLEVKIFGGGQIIKEMTNIGKKNCNFILEYIRTENLMLTAEDLGDIFPRKVHYLPKTGKVFVKRLHSLHNTTLAERERRYLQNIQTQKVEGGVELF